MFLELHLMWAEGEWWSHFRWCDFRSQLWPFHLGCLEQVPLPLWAWWLVSEVKIMSQSSWECDYSHHSWIYHYYYYYFMSAYSGQNPQKFPVSPTEIKRSICSWDTVIVFSDYWLLTVSFLAANLVPRAMFGNEDELILVGQCGASLRPDITRHHSPHSETNEKWGTGVTNAHIQL